LPTRGSSPLGMGTTRFLDDHTRIVPARATGYAPRAGRVRGDMSDWEQTGDGAVQTTVLDFARWILSNDDPKVGADGSGRCRRPPRSRTAGLIPTASASGPRSTAACPRWAMGSWAGYRADLQLPGKAWPSCASAT
jgi:hypothetical protein